MEILNLIIYNLIDFKNLNFKIFKFKKNEKNRKFNFFNLKYSNNGIFNKEIRIKREKSKKNK